VLNGRSAILEEPLERVHIRAAAQFEQPEAERLCQRRLDAVEHRVRAGGFNPARAAVGIQTGAGVDEECVGSPFGALEGKVGQREMQMRRERLDCRLHEEVKTRN
jgi:hypothetical protein